MRHEHEPPGHVEHLRPVVERRRPQDVQDLVELVDLVGALEHGLPAEKLEQQTAAAPAVHLVPVVRRAEQQLGRPVPERDDPVGVRHGLRLRVVDLLGEAEVRDLQVAEVVDQEVRALDVAVDDLLLVQVLQPDEQLPGEVLDVAARQADAAVHQDARKIVGHVLEPHRDRVLVGHDDLVDQTDVGVVELL